MTFLGPLYRDSYMRDGKGATTQSGKVATFPGHAPCCLQVQTIQRLFTAKRDPYIKGPKRQFFLHFLTIFSAAHLDFPSFFAGARAWARGPRRRMENVFFLKWVVEPLPREAALAADLITASLIRLLAVPGQ